MSATVLTKAEQATGDTQEKDFMRPFAVMLNTDKQIDNGSRVKSELPSVSKLRPP